MFFYGVSRTYAEIFSLLRICSRLLSNSPGLSTSLESLAILADRAVASELDVKDSSVGVAEVRVNDNERLIGIMEDISRRLKKLENPGTQEKQFNNKQQTDNRSHRTSNK